MITPEMYKAELGTTAVGLCLISEYLKEKGMEPFVRAIDPTDIPDQFPREDDTDPEVLEDVRRVYQELGADLSEPLIAIWNGQEFHIGPYTHTMAAAGATLPEPETPLDDVPL